MAVEVSPRTLGVSAGQWTSARAARSWRAWVLLLSAGAFASCSGGGSGGSSGGGSSHDYLPPDPPALVFGAGDTLGELELELPQADTFALRATLPVPKHFFPRTDGATPVVVRDTDGTTYAAQVETVTRYASDADGADVVEVLARVARPASAAPGQRVRYAVVYQPTAPAALSVDPDVAALLAGGQTIVARTHDCFHNEYTSDLWGPAQIHAPSVRTLRSGPVADQRATHSILAPTLVVDGATGTLPHMFGVHAYLTRWADEPFVTLDLRVHNALSGKDTTSTIDNPLAKLYFADFELRLPPGWVVLNAFDDPYFGTPYDEDGYRVWPIVRPIGDGTLHVIPQTGQFERRLAICREGSEARALEHLREGGLAFCRSGTNAANMPYFSWWNESTARYFPQRQELPYLESIGEANLRAAETGELWQRTTQVATGAAGLWPAISTGFGWAHPWGVSEAGMVSGSEIYLYEGIVTAAGASRDGYRLHQLVHRMYTDRQHNVLYDYDGQPTRWETWALDTPSGRFLPVWWYNAPMLWAADPFGFTIAPQFQNQYVAANGLAPAYEAGLLAYDSIDEAHLIRYTRTPKALVWLGNDALAKDDLSAQAEGILFAYNETPQDLYGGIVPTGLLAAENFVSAYPGHGIFYGRGEAWGLDVVCASYSLQTPEWRARVRPWFGKVIDVLERGQSSCSGTIQNTPLGNVFGGKYGCHQSIEAAITENALVSMRESVYAGSDLARTLQVNKVLRKSAYAMIGPLKWSNVYHGPWAMMAVSPANIAKPQFCSYVPADGNYGYPDHYQIWSTFAYGYEITRDTKFLAKAREALGVADLHAMEADPLENIQNKAALLALVQRMN